MKAGVRFVPFCKPLDRMWRNQWTLRDQQARCGPTACRDSESLTQSRSLKATVSTAVIRLVSQFWPPARLSQLLSWCLTSTEARWPIRDGDRVGRGRESERLDRGNRPKKTGETVDRRQNNGSVKAVSPRHCPATCAPRNCSFNCCAGQSH